MAGYTLPTSAEINGISYDIRSDYRAVLDVIDVLGEYSACQNDSERNECVQAALSIFYIDYATMPLYQLKDAYTYMVWFLNGGEEEHKSTAKKPKLMDWKQDFPLIIAPINRVAGCEVRSVDYMHWWTFLAYYREIGDCFFAQVVSIRKKKAKGKKLDKSDKEFYDANRDVIDLKVEYSQAEKDLFDEWGGA